MKKKGVVLLIILTLSFTVSGWAQYFDIKDGLFIETSELSLTKEEAAQLENIKKRPTTKEVRTVTIKHLNELEYANSIFLNLFPTQNYTTIKKTVKDKGNSKISWIGKIDGEANSVVMVRTKIGLTASLWAKGELYRVEPLGKDAHVIIAVDKTKFPKGCGTKDDITPHDHLSSKSSESGTKTTPIINVFIAYTSSVDEQVGDIEGLIDTAEEETNDSFDNSDVTAIINVVHTYECDYDESSATFSEHLVELAGDSDIDKLNYWYGGDVVVLLVNDTDGGTINGIAETIGAQDLGDSYCIVYYDAATGDYTFGHEIGHLLNCRHDWDADKTEGTNHGYIYETGNWRTIMAVTSGTNRIQYWSNPTVQYGGVNMGTAAREDCAGEIDDNAPDMRDFNVSHPPPASFTVTADGNDNPYLSWGSCSGVSSYKVYRCFEEGESKGEPPPPDKSSEWERIVTTSNTYYTDTEVDILDEPGKSTQGYYYYKVTAVYTSYDSDYSNTVYVFGEICQKKLLLTKGNQFIVPGDFALHQNHPNPFNPTTNIQYQIPEPSNVKIAIYDISGREIISLVNEYQEAGYHTIKWDASKQTSGTYLCKMESKNFKAIRKLLLLK